MAGLSKGMTAVSTVERCPKTIPETGSLIIGNLCVTEMHDIAYDANSNVIISGNQDTGTTYQPTSGAPEWNSLSTADGGDVAVDNITLSSSNQSIRYSSFQNLGAFRKTIWDANGALLASSYPSLGGFNDYPQFVTPMELNRIDPTHIVFGGANFVFESFNQGENVSPFERPPFVRMLWHMAVLHQTYKTQMFYG